MYIGVVYKSISGSGQCGCGSESASEDAPKNSFLKPGSLFIISPHHALESDIVRERRLQPHPPAMHTLS